MQLYHIVCAIRFCPTQSSHSCQHTSDVLFMYINVRPLFSKKWEVLGDYLCSDLFMYRYVKYIFILKDFIFSFIKRSFMKIMRTVAFSLARSRR
jgi:hypothetical protein